MNEPTTGMRNYIPTDADVRNRYGMGVWWELNDSSGDARAEFDRWLAEHDREKQAQAPEDQHPCWPCQIIALIKGENK